MSYSRDKRRKALRKKASPEAKRIRRLIKTGELPAYKVEKQVSGKKRRRKTTLKLVSTFKLLTAAEGGGTS